MPVLAVANRKGGVGKTTSAVNLAAAFATLGRRTLLVDLDPQGSAGHALGVRSPEERGASAGFRAKEEWRVLEPRPTLPGLGLVPADTALGEEETRLVDSARRRGRLARHLGDAAADWDVVVLDTPPSIGALLDAALRSADGVVIPTAADFLAVEALHAALGTIRAAEKERESRYAPLALLPTFVDRRRPPSLRAVALLREHFGDLVLPAEVPRSARFDGAATAGVPLVLRAPATPPAAAYVAAARDLLGRMGRASPKSGKASKSFRRADARSAISAGR